MRKRESLKLAKEINELTNKFQGLVVGQLSGSIYYFEANSDVKGFDFAYAAQRNAMSLARKLKKLLDIAADWHTKGR